MNTHAIASSSVPLDDSWDVIVLGGGMAGTFAALAAAKAGARVLLVEPANVLGGQGTAGGVAGFCGDTALVNDDFRELETRLVALQAIEPLNPLADRRPYHLEWCAFCLQEMAAARGVELLLHARAIAAETKDGRVLSVQVATSGDVLRVEAAQFIDATGQCWLVRQAGLPTDHLGANQQLPMSLYFTLWDTGAPVTPVLPEGCPTWASDDDLPMTTLEPGPGGRLDVKMKVIGFDAADGRDYSRAEQAARRTMAGLIYHLQTRGYRGKQYDRHTLASVSRALGVREQRRIIGEHLLTEAEVLGGTRFPDAVAVGTYHLDFHWPDRVQRAGTGICTMTEPYHIPLRCLRPRGAVNLLVPGRGSAGDQMAMSSFRVMATVIQMGTAAGLAAAQCVARRCDLDAVDLPRLQQDLAAAGQELRLARYGGYLRQHRLATGLLFEPGSSFAQCHASTLAQLDDGRFVAAFFAGTKEGHVDTAIWLTQRDGGRWSPPRRLFKVGDQQHWNPVLFVAPDGLLHVWFKVGPDCARWKSWHAVSTDGGDNWTVPQPFLHDQPLPRGPVRNQPIVTAEGVWLAGASDELRPDADGRTWWPFIDRSEDDGRTWTATPIRLEAGAPAGKGGIQPTLWESTPGHVHCLLRTGIGAVYRSDSADGGRTWGPAYRTELPNNNSGIAVAKLADGRLALAWNPVAGDWAARTPLRLSLSADNGLTWTHHLDLATGPGEFSYPAVLATATGIAVTWTDRRTSIAFWHGAAERLRQAAVDKPE